MYSNPYNNNDRFFSQKTCDRCGGSLENGRIMSMFNTECICMDCKQKERKRPDYKMATEAEMDAVRHKTRNFIGIGLHE